MTVTYRTDPDTGRRYAWGGLIGCRGIDDRVSEREDFVKVLERRADILRPQSRLTRRQRERIQYRLGWRADDVTGLVACPECQADNRRTATTARTAAILSCRCNRIRGCRREIRSSARSAIT
jgi:hypothetical protein